MALRLMMGPVASVLLASQRVRPQRLMADGFTFAFPELAAALADLVEES
jgi:NAD dependent epimerase/dehydratase family enzyme